MILRPALASNQNIIDISFLASMMAPMRTTVTIQDDLATQIEALRQREGLSFKAALDQLLRLGVQAKAAPPKPKRCHTPTKRLGLRPGIDPTRLNSLLDDLDTSDFTSREN